MSNNALQAGELDIISTAENHDSVWSDRKYLLFTARILHLQMSNGHGYNAEGLQRLFPDRVLELVKSLY